MPAIPDQQVARQEICKIVPATKKPDAKELIDEVELARTQRRVAKGLELTGLLSGLTRPRLKWRFDALAHRAGNTFRRRSDDL